MCVTSRYGTQLGQVDYRTILLFASPALRRRANNPFEMSTQMRLVGETTRNRDRRQ